MATLLRILGYTFLALVFTIVLVLPLVAGLLVEIDKRRLRAVARTTACLRCGERLGDAAVARADELWGRHMQTLFERHPGTRFRIVRRFDAACTCGARYAFEKGAGFREVALTLAFEE